MRGTRYIIIGDKRKPMVDVLLASAPVRKRTKHSRMNPPLGLAYIGAVLLKNGYTVSAEDFNVSTFTPNRVAGILAQRKPRIVGISVNTETYLNGLRLAEISKKVDPRTVVVMGGAHASVMHREVAREKNVDIVVRGEGEYTMLALADCLVRNQGSLAEIEGITFERDGELVETPDRPFICNPDELPFPARNLFPIPMYEQPAQVLLSRGGCPFNCVFCAVNNIWKGGRRYRAPERVLDEIREVNIATGIAEIGFADDTFTLNRERVLSLCEKSRALRDELDWSWTCTTRADLVDRDLLAAMREAGCHRVTYGVETGSQQVLDSIGKRVTLDRIREAVGTALDVGLAVLCSFMFPHPWDTEETVQEQKLFMRELVDRGATVTMALTTPFPGTEYYDRADELGIKLLTDNWEEFDAKHLIISTRHLSKEKLEALLEELIDYVGLQAQLQQ